MRSKALVVGATAVAVVLLTACPPPPPPPPPPPSSTATTVGTTVTIPQPKPCPAAPANTTPGPDSLTESPMSSWGVGGVANGGGFTATVLGNVVYVGGLFSQALPPSGAPVARSNLAAFCLANGQLLEAFVANVNGQVWALTNDGTSIFAAGDFTTLNGQPANRLVKLDPLTGAPVGGFNPPAIPGPVYALDYSSVTGDVYAGGDFRLARHRRWRPDEGRQLRPQRRHLPALEPEGRRSHRLRRGERQRAERLHRRQLQERRRGAARQHGPDRAVERGREQHRLRRRTRA